MGEEKSATDKGYKHRKAEKPVYSKRFFCFELK
jgi:hypothetical protein